MSGGLGWAVIIVGAAVITVALYGLWRLRQLAKRVAAHDKALRLSETNGELNDGRHRHLRAVPVVAAMAAAGMWLRDHHLAGRPVLTAAVTFIAAAAILVAIWPHAPARPGAVPPRPAPPPTTVTAPPSTTTVTVTAPTTTGPVTRSPARPGRPVATSRAPTAPTTVRPPTSPPTTTTRPTRPPAGGDDDERDRRPKTCVSAWHDPQLEAHVCANG